MILNQGGRRRLREVQKCRGASSFTSLTDYSNRVYKKGMPEGVQIPGREFVCLFCAKEGILRNNGRERNLRTGKIRPDVCR